MPLSVVEAMSIGMPIVALSTTELPEVIENGVNGFISNNVDYLIECMQLLLDDFDLASQLGKEARATAEEKFSIGRFTRDWERAFSAAIELGGGPLPA
jgi:glycosyltransferase involved in cell wall biosynthesis